jgi:hypothetical protein
MEAPMSGKRGNGGQRLSTGLIAGAGIGLVVWMFISSQSGAGFNVALFAIGSAMMLAGLAAGVVLVRWAERFAGQERRAEPVKIPVERHGAVMPDKREDE